MSIQPISRSSTYTANRDWLASLHGTDQTETITLDLSKFTAGTHYAASTDPVQPYSRFLSGVPVGRITATGLYGLWTKANTDGTQVFAGVVFAEAYFAPGQTRVPAALLWHGVVHAAKVPGGPLNPADVTLSPTAAQIRFV
ncbi:head decoration protein [Streptomyces sp. NPDC056465]|uniref:head decoration protein n=1 Tax=Streptomyces sp. NPDC056465 TaxID=3345829 RepID=UPI0036C022B6